MKNSENSADKHGKLNPLARPVRVQRKRSRGWKMPENTIYVGRPSKWGNPHSMKDYEFESADQNRHAAVRDFKHDLECGMLSINKNDIVMELRGKNLACWCNLECDCHADVLLSVANDCGQQAGKPVEIVEEVR